MGQMTFALLYGVEQPEGIDLWGEDGDSGLVIKLDLGGEAREVTFDLDESVKLYR